jgi:hypothetical protein
MKISQDDFMKIMYYQYGNTTCFVYDEPNNRYNYASGEISDDTLEPFFHADRIEVEELEEDSYVSSIMIENWASEMKSPENIQDDNFVPMIRNMFGTESKIYVAVNGSSKVYILVY